MPVLLPSRVEEARVYFVLRVLTAVLQYLVPGTRYIPGTGSEYSSSSTLNVCRNTAVVSNGSVRSTDG